MYTLSNLTKDIQSGASIAVHTDGTWHKRFDPWGLTSLFRRLFILERKDNFALASLVKHFIKSTEITSKNLHVASIPESDLDIENAITAVKKRLESQQNSERKAYKSLGDQLSELKTLRDLTQDSLGLAKEYKQPPHAIKSIEERLEILERRIKNLQKTIIQHELTAPTTKKINKLAIHFFAKQMRQVEQSAINNATAKDNDIEWVKRELTPWKKRQFPAMPQEFSNDDLSKIESLCKYGKAIELMREDRSYRESIFKVVFKTPNDSAPNIADIAVQFPALTKKITSSFIDKRVRPITKTVGLSFKEENTNGVIKKDVFLRIQKRVRAITGHDAYSFLSRQKGRR